MTAHGSNETAGIGDPYWYEWSVGLMRLLDMLDPANGIKSVTIQADELQGLDDVVVDYHDGRRRCVQVKHTREAASITFGDLVAEGLLNALAVPWQQALQAGHPCTAELYTNRAVGRRVWTPRGGGTARPALATFWPHLKRESQVRGTLDEIEMPPEWAGAWEEWKAALSPLTPAEQLEFIRSLEIVWDSPGLEDTEEQLRQRLQALFSCSSAQATELLSALDAALRKWTTTSRTSPAITEEAAYAALGLPTEGDISNHLIAPPEPFFPSRQRFCDDLVATLRSADTRMVFLVGNPGSGKTSIVSAIANRRTPAIDARYHAYRPITPDTQHLPPDADVDVSPAGLWGSLLSQLRQHLRGRLAEKRVPIRNRFLSPDRMRQEVLRISDDIGRERGQPFVIAIDGIDHAARSSEPNARALLASLPEPEHVPEHVRLLIAGQPPEAWPQYPDWLRDPQASFLRCDAPKISDEDVATLVAARCPPELGSLDIVARLVSDASNGDTLAAVFAVEESRLATSADNLRERLSRRRLHSGVRAYYAQIWDALALRLGAEHPFDALRLGAVLALFDQRVTPTMLAKVFADRNVPQDDWQEALLSLRPLVIGENGAYRLTHNDIRVFLAAKLRAEPERTRLVASHLADFCRSDPDAGDSRYTLTMEMLKLAERTREIPVVFDAEFVVSGWRRGISFEVLEQRGEQAARVLAALPPQWHTLQSLVCALLTLQQLDRSTDRLEFRRDHVNAASVRVVPALIAECRVVGAASWTEDEVRHALRDAEQLLDAGETERARGLLRRWFRDVSPPQLKEYIEKATESFNDHTVDSVLRRYGSSLWRAWGRDVFDSATIEEGDGAAWAKFYAGYLDAAAASKSVAWVRAFSAMRMLDLGAAEEHVTELATAEHWLSTAFALRRLQQYREDFSDLFVTEAAVWALLIGKEDLTKAWVEPLEKDLFGFVRASESHDRASLAVAAAFIQGWRTRRPLEAIREDVVNAYSQRYSRMEAVERVTLLSFGAAVAGRWLCIAEPPLSVDRARDLLSRLLEHVRPLDLYREYPRLAPMLVRLLIQAGRRTGGQYADALDRECEQFAKAGFYGPAMPTVWAVLHQRGNVAALSEWTEKRFGPDGGGWDLDTGARVSELEMLAKLCMTVPGLEAKAEELNLLRRAAALGYLADDEYVLAHPLQWFRKLVKVNPAIWDSYGSWLLALSHEADMGGDNRLSPSIEAATASAAALCSPNALARLNRATLDGERWFDANSRQWIDGTLRVFPELSLDVQSFLAMWPLLLSQLSWREKDDLAYLHDASNAVDSYAVNNGLMQERSRIEDAARLEWTIARNLAHARRSNEQALGEAESEQIAECQQGSILDAIRRLIARLAVRSRLSEAWRAFEAIAQRIVDERLEDAADLAWALFSALSDHREMRAGSWRFEGLDKTVHLLAPILNETHQWDVVRSVIGRLDERDQLSVTQLVDDLDGLCLAVASGERLESGLRQHLQTQELWLPPGRQLRRPQLDTLPEPATWPEFAVACVLDVLSCDSGVLNLAAMRAMFVLLRLVPAAFDVLMQKATALARPDREAVAQLAEHVAVTAPADFARFESFLKHCEQSNCFELELQAWIARCAYARATSASPPDLVLAPLASRPPAIVSPTRLVVVTPDKKAAAQSVMGMQAVASLIRQLRHSVDVGARKVEAAFFVSIEKNPFQRSERPRRVRNGDHQFGSTEEVERLYDVLRSGFSGSIDATLAVRLAQAALMQDEPSVIFGDWPVRPDMWPTDDELRKLLDGPQLHVRQRLWNILLSDLNDDETVFAGTLYVCGYSVEMLFHLLPWFRNDDRTIGAQTNSTTFGGRMFAYPEPHRFDAQEDEEPPCWLALLGRGLSRAPHQNIGVVPSTRLQLEGGWGYEGAVRGAFIAGDGSRVQYERVLGAPRAQARERCFRDPYFERWVCKRTAIEDLERRLRGSISFVPDFEIFKTDDE